MPLPSSVSTYLDEVAQPFGGLEPARTLVGEESLEYLFTFPGFICVVKPWAAYLDLRDYGYQEDTVYKIFNARLEFQYLGRSSNGIFGDKEQDIAWLFELPHGSFVHIQFDTLSGPTLGLLWVCTELSAQQIRSQIHQWESLASQLDRKITTHELFLTPQGLPDNAKVRVSFLPGLWREALSPEKINNHINTERVTHDVIQVGYLNVIALYPKQSGWYLFEMVVGSQRDLLTLDRLEGIGHNRVRHSASGAYYFELAQRSLSAQRSVHQLPTVYSTLAEDDRLIKLEGYFGWFAPYLCLGSSEAITTLLIHRGFTAGLESSAEIYGSIAPSVQATLDSNGQASGAFSVSSLTVLEAIATQSALVSRRIELSATLESTGKIIFLEPGSIYTDATLEVSSSHAVHAQSRSFCDATLTATSEQEGIANNFGLRLGATLEAISTQTSLAARKAKFDAIAIGTTETNAPSQTSLEAELEASAQLTAHAFSRSRASTLLIEDTFVYASAQYSVLTMMTNLIPYAPYEVDQMELQLNVGDAANEHDPLEKASPNGYTSGYGSNVEVTIPSGSGYSESRINN